MAVVRVSDVLGKEDVTGAKKETTRTAYLEDRTVNDR